MSQLAMSHDVPFVNSVDDQISVETSKKYWSDVPATVDGMLGGYPQVSKIDLRASQIFIAKLRRSGASKLPEPAPLLTRGLDCGAGIGRIAAGLLTHVCSTVDILEPIAKFAERASALPENELGPGRIGKAFVCGLEEWYPDPAVKYDLIWHQWCLGHLNNDSLEAYLARCKTALDPGGWIVVKENISTTEDLYDDEDSSVTRTEASYRANFYRGGLKVVRADWQRGFPASLGLYPVRLFALQPRD